MRLPLFLSVVWTSAALSGWAIAAEPKKAEPAPAPADAILKKLNDAKLDNAKAIIEADNRFLAALEARLKAATERGDLKAAEALTNAKKDFEADGKVRDPVTDVFIRQARAARDREVALADIRLARVFEDAVKEYVKAGRLDEAKAVQTELDARSEARPSAAHRDHIDSSNAKVMDGFLRCASDNASSGDAARSIAIATKEKYTGPIDITVVARTDSTNLRLWMGRTGTVIFNWHASLKELAVIRPGGRTLTSDPIRTPMPPLNRNHWYTIRWRVAGDGMTIWVDGKQVFHESRVYDLSAEEPVRIGGAFGSIVDVKSLTVTRLK